MKKYMLWLATQDAPVIKKVEASSPLEACQMHFGPNFTQADIYSENQGVYELYGDHSLFDMSIGDAREDLAKSIGVFMLESMENAEEDSLTL